MSREDTELTTNAAREAANWFALMQDADVSKRDRARFLEWLTESSRHVHEYLAVCAVWRSIDQSDAARLSAEQLIAEARSDAPSNVIELARAPLSVSAPAVSSRSRSRSKSFSVAAAIACLAILVAGGWFGVDRWKYGARYATGIGEQTSFTLADGSIVRLNTQSSVLVKLTDSAREVTLTDGEAMFQVAKDSKRPFRVHAGEAIVEALGTVFNVYRSSEQTTVTVLEGRVRVTAEPKDVADASQASVSGAPMRTAELAPRARAYVSKGTIVASERDVSPEEASAWTQRRLVFDVQPLQKVVEEFNRYNQKQLQITDPALARMEISGNFNANDPDSLVEFLVRTESVVASADSEGVLRLYRE
jgi:transmembrane sensor